MPEIEVADLRPSKEVKEFHPFKPILDRLLIRRLESTEDWSGFAAPAERYREPEARGEVMAIGDGVTLGREWHPMSEFVNVGDHVLFGEHTCEKIMVDGELREIVRLQDVRGVRRLVRECSHQWEVSQRTGSMVFSVCPRCLAQKVDTTNA